MRNWNGSKLGWHQYWKIAKDWTTIEDNPVVQEFDVKEELDNIEDTCIVDLVIIDEDQRRDEEELYEHESTRSTNAPYSISV